MTFSSGCGAGRRAAASPASAASRISARHDIVSSARLALRATATGDERDVQLVVQIWPRRNAGAPVRPRPSPPRCRRIRAASTAATYLPRPLLHRSTPTGRIPSPAIVATSGRARAGNISDGRIFTDPAPESHAFFRRGGRPVSSVVPGISVPIPRLGRRDDRNCRKYFGGRTPPSRWDARACAWFVISGPAPGRLSVLTNDTQPSRK